MQDERRILVVNDYRTMLRIIRNLLKQLGFENVAEAENGEAALALLNTGGFDLVIADWGMQPMTGYELLRRIRSRPHLERLPFLMVTSGNRAEDGLAAEAAGASQHIVKPFDVNTLKSGLERVFCA